MARAALGFHGTVLARVLDGSGDAEWGAGNWAAEPLYAASGLRGVSLHYQAREIHLSERQHMQLFNRSAAQSRRKCHGARPS